MTLRDPPLPPTRHRPRLRGVHRLREAGVVRAHAERPAPPARCGRSLGPV